MARAAVIPGVSATDLPQQKSSRGRPRAAATLSNEQKEVKNAEPAKRGRKPGKTTTTAKNKKKDDRGEEEEHDDDDDDEDVLSLDVAATSTKKAASTVKGRATGRAPRKTAAKTVMQVDAETEEDDDELADFEVQGKKTGRPQAKGKTATSATTKPTRGRPKAVKVNNEQEVVGAPQKKTTTRGRKTTASKQVAEADKTIYVTTASSTASNLAKSRPLGDPARKKKVTFADLADSEDGYSSAEEQKQPTRVVKKSTASQKAAGLKAKPVRKTGTATRGRPPKAHAAKPLSPKKATQLAKGLSASSASSGDEDELASEKTVYSLVVQKSPTKTQEQQHTGLSSPVKRIRLPGQTSTPAKHAVNTRQDENSLLSMQKIHQPPSALRDAVLMGSPARRPPPSTSKETIRDTPRRGPLFINYPSASKLSSNPDASTFLQKLSPLKASPKKGGNLGASFMSAASPDKAAGSTPFNAKMSLLQSPAKRVQSPFIFQRRDNNKWQSVRDDVDVDTEMDNDNDTFANKCRSQATLSAYPVVEELSGDELLMDSKPIRDANNSDDVFVDDPEPMEDDHQVYEDEGKESDADDYHVEDEVQIVGEFAELVVDADVADDTQQPGEEAHADEDVVMDNDESLCLNEDDAKVSEVHDEEAFNADTTAEIKEDIPSAVVEPHEDCESPNKDEDAVAGEDVEEIATTESVEQNAEESTEVPAVSDHVVMYAERENEEEEEEDEDVPEVETPRSNTTLTSARSSVDPRDIVGAPRDIVGADEDDENDCRSAEGTPTFVPPAAPSPPPISPARAFRMSFRDNSNQDTYSEYSNSPASRRQSNFSRRDSILPQSRSDSADDTFSSLAAKLSSWKANSPEKMRKGTAERSIFSPVVPSKLSNPRQSIVPGNKYTQIQTMRRSLAARYSSAHSIVMDGDEPDTLGRQPQDEPGTSTLSQNTATTATSETASSAAFQGKSNLRLSMSITPVRINRDTHRTVHTVSKVPLKPEADESPIKYPRKRARSMSTDIQLPLRASPSRFKLIPKSRKSSSSSSSSASPSSTKRSPLAEVETQEYVASSPTPATTTPSKSTTSTAATPRQTPKTSEQFLRGAVVFVDVHTTEGEDASGIFIELLTQMGAKCVKSWSWNPRSSQSPGVDGAEPVMNTSKVGITHVVYKDGGVRTMEKVRQAGDLVKCVGVGWVLDCERANKWIDEEHYHVDSTIIPRGGAKRRKSMQPRALANVNGSLSLSSSSSSSSLSSSTNSSNTTSTRRSRLPSDWEDTMEDLRRMSPGKDVPKTPNTSLKSRTDTGNNNSSDPNADYNFNFDFDFSAMSPATPYFLSQNANLMQQTCPPKQTNQGLFSSYTSSSSSSFSSARRGEEGGNVSSGAGLRAKLEAARRKTLAFKPRFGSPLSQG